MQNVSNKGKQVMVDLTSELVQMFQGETSVRNQNIDSMPKHLDAAIHGPDVVIDVELRRSNHEDAMLRPANESNLQVNDTFDSDDEHVEHIFYEMTTPDQKADDNQMQSNFSSKHVSNSLKSVSGSKTPVYAPYNPVVIKDIQIVGKFWSNEGGDDMDDSHDCTFSASPHLELR